jgi:hypothetical protein
MQWSKTKGQKDKQCNGLTTKGQKDKQGNGLKQKNKKTNNAMV